MISNYISSYSIVGCTHGRLLLGYHSLGKQLMTPKATIPDTSRTSQFEGKHTKVCAPPDRRAHKLCFVWLCVWLL